MSSISFGHRYSLQKQRFIAMPDNDMQLTFPVLGVLFTMED